MSDRTDRNGQYGQNVLERTKRTGRTENLESWVLNLAAVLRLPSLKTEGFFMFEEICRKTGVIRIPTGEYLDSAPVFEDHTVSYFTMTETFRNADGVQQSADHFRPENAGNFFCGRIGYFDAKKEDCPRDSPL